MFSISANNNNYTNVRLIQQELFGALDHLKSIIGYIGLIGVT